MRTGSSVYWIHSDHLGSASLTTNISGQVVSEMRFYPFGEVRWQNGTIPTDRTFTSQLAEPTGLGSLMNYNAREYSPVLGRFLSADTIVPKASAPQSFNRYSNDNLRVAHCLQFCTVFRPFFLECSGIELSHLPRLR